MSRTTLLFAFVPLLLQLALACEAPIRGGGGGDGAGQGGQDGGSGGSPGGSSDASGAPSRGCSGDLRKVVGSNGATIMECPIDQGCAGAKCVPACEAAATSHGSLGCDFLLPTLPGLGPCFAAFVANAWPKDVRIEVSRGASKFTTTSFARVPDGTPKFTKWPALPASGLPQDRGAVLFLSMRDDMLCPVPHAVTGGAGGYETGRGTAFHIRTDVPVTVYDIVPFGGALSFVPSAELDMPTTAWGKEYVAVVPPLGKSGDLQPAAQIVAAEDGTTLTVIPTVDLPSGAGVSAAPKGLPTTYSLHAGESLQWLWSYKVMAEDMTGSIVIADKPISFFGGAPGMIVRSVDSTAQACCADYGHQQIPSVSVLGWEYVGAPYTTRRKDLMDESIVYRLVGIVDGTTLTFDPPVPGAPSTIDLGGHADFQVRGPFRAASQGKDYPFFVTQFMAGSNLAAGTRSKLNTNLGDPEQVNLLPPQQFLSKYVFYTDSTYGNTSLAVTRVKSASGFKDVTVDCIGPVTGWRAAGGDGMYEVANVDLSRDWEKVGSCTDGIHVAESDATFGLVVWGLDQDASYGYPAGGNAHPINSACVNRTAGCY